MNAPIIPTHKRCVRCTKVTLLSQMKKAKGRAFGVSSWCQKCANEHWVDNKYSQKRRRE